MNAARARFLGYLLDRLSEVHPTRSACSELFDRASVAGVSHNEKLSAWKYVSGLLEAEHRKEKGS